MSQSLSIQEQGSLLALVFPSFATDIGLFSGIDVRDARIESDSCLEIKDLLGGSLFREFAIRSPANQKIGVVRSSGRGVELPLIDCMFFGQALFEPKTAEAEILALARADNPAASVSSEGFVCYGYPRVGVQVSVNKGGSVSKVIYDAHSQYLVKSWPVKVTAAKLGVGYEGEPIYSYVSLLPEGGDPEFEQNWENYLRLARKAVASRGLSLAGLSTLKRAMDKAAARGNPEPEVLPAMRGLILPVRLIAQETPVYCAVASAKMMLSYLDRAEPTQQQIAAAFNTGPSGTTNDDMVSGLNALAPGWSARVSFEGDYDTATALLDHMIPVKSGIPGHARLLRGWREYVFLNRKTGGVAFSDRYFLVNDPYPVGAGQVVLENVSKPISDYYRNFLSLLPTQAASARPPA